MHNLHILVIDIFTWLEMVYPSEVAVFVTRQNTETKTPVNQQAEKWRMKVMAQREWRRTNHEVNNVNLKLMAHIQVVILNRRPIFLPSKILTLIYLLTFIQSSFIHLVFLDPVFFHPVFLHPVFFHPVFLDPVFLHSSFLFTLSPSSIILHYNLRVTRVSSRPFASLRVSRFTFHHVPIAFILLDRVFSRLLFPARFPTTQSQS